jgi:hypothetical protein
MGIDPNKQNQIEFSVVNKTYFYSLEDIVLKQFGMELFDFWWYVYFGWLAMIYVVDTLVFRPDWQQGGTQGGAAGGKQNPTIW